MIIYAGISRLLYSSLCAVLVTWIHVDHAKTDIGYVDDWIYPGMHMKDFNDAVFKLDDLGIIGNQEGYGHLSFESQGTIYSIKYESKNLKVTSITIVGECKIVHCDSFSDRDKILTDLFHRKYWDHITVKEEPFQVLFVWE